MGGEIEICWELISIPSDVRGTHVRIDATKCASFVGDGELMLHRMTRESCVIGLDVKFKVI